MGENLWDAYCSEGDALAARDALQKIYISKRNDFRYEYAYGTEYCQACAAGLANGAFTGRISLENRQHSCGCDVMACACITGMKTQSSRQVSRVRAAQTITKHAYR